LYRIDQQKGTGGVDSIFLFDVQGLSQGLRLVPKNFVVCWIAGNSD